MAFLSDCKMKSCPSCRYFEWLLSDEDALNIIVHEEHLQTAKLLTAGHISWNPQKIKTGEKYLFDKKKPRVSKNKSHRRRQQQIFSYELGKIDIFLRKGETFVNDKKTK